MCSDIVCKVADHISSIPSNPHPSRSIEDQNKNVSTHSTAHPRAEKWKKIAKGPAEKHTKKNRSRHKTTLNQSINQSKKSKAIKSKSIDQSINPSINQQSIYFSFQKKLVIYEENFFLNFWKTQWLEKFLEKNQTAQRETSAISAELFLILHPLRLKGQQRNRSSDWTDSKTEPTLPPPRPPHQRQIPSRFLTWKSGERKRLFAWKDSKRPRD